MVLTDFECWAHHGAINAGESDFETAPNNRRVDLFNPRSVSHISSNGYYGFSYINAAHEQNDNNNNTNNISNNNNIMDSTMISVSTTNVPATDTTGPALQRCKKRFYAGYDDNNDAEQSKLILGATGLSVDSGAVAKRCRYDDGDDLAAQYCNDFFSLPSTHIGTQSCLMDIEEQVQQQQQQQQEPYQPEINQIQHLQQQQQEQQQQQYNQADSNNKRLHNYNSGFNALEKTQDHIQMPKNAELDSAAMFVTMHGGCLHHYNQNTYESNDNENNQITDF